MQYRQNVFPIAHYHNRKNFLTSSRCSENHNNTCTKICGLKFDAPYRRHLAAQRKNEQVHNYKSSPIKCPKTFLKIARHNSILVSTNNGASVRFWHDLYELYSFLWHPVTSWQNIFLYRCTSTVCVVKGSKGCGRTFLSPRF